MKSRNWSMVHGHKPDEWVAVEQLDRCQAVLRALVERLEADL